MWKWFSYILTVEANGMGRSFSQLSMLKVIFFSLSPTLLFYSILFYSIYQQGGLGGLKYPLLADFNKTISRDYGVLLEDAGIALRGLFLIDPEGVLKHMSVNDLPVGRSVEETLRLLKAFQFVAEHGEGE